MVRQGLIMQRKSWNLVSMELSSKIKDLSGGFLKGDVCFFTLLHYPLWRPHFFFYPNDLLTQFSILPWQEIKKKKIFFFLKIFIIFSRIFKKIFVFSRFFPCKMGNYQRIFDFSIGEALYRSLPYILKKSWKNI